MKATIQAIGVFALALGLASMATAEEQAPTKRVNEYERQQNTPAPKQGTHESRQAERKAQRAVVKQQAKNGEMPEVGDDWGMKKNPQAKPEGTHASRVAERQEKRGEVKQLVKAGEMPVTNEATVGAVK